MIGMIRFYAEGVTESPSGRVAEWPSGRVAEWASR